LPHIGPNPQHEVQMVAQDSEPTDVDGKHGGQLL
jgi:hypothetical protein